MLRRATHLTGPYPKQAAGIALGCASRITWLTWLVYIEDALEELSDQFKKHEFLIIRDLVNQVSRLQLDQSGNQYKNEWPFRSSVDSQLNLIILPTLANRLDRSSVATDKYDKWYQLGVGCGEFSRAQPGTSTASYLF
jgi:hypothetical protein